MISANNISTETTYRLVVDDITPGDPRTKIAEEDNEIVNEEDQNQIVNGQETEEISANTNEGTQENSLGRGNNTAATNIDKEINSPSYNDIKVDTDGDDFRMNLPL